jgi:ABC-type multidrug transport system fused ATPase/permease subunit
MRPPFKGEIEFDRVSFSYAADAPVLNVSFRISPPGRGDRASGTKRRRSSA